MSKFCFLVAGQVLVGHITGSKTQSQHDLLSQIQTTSLSQHLPLMLVNITVKQRGATSRLTVKLWKWKWMVFSFQIYKRVKLMTEYVWNKQVSNMTQKHAKNCKTIAFYFKLKTYLCVHMCFLHRAISAKNLNRVSMENILSKWKNNSEVFNRWKSKWLALWMVQKQN